MLWFFESFFPVVWIAFLIYWRIKAAGTKTTQRSEPALLGILLALRLPGRDPPSFDNSHPAAVALPSALAVWHLALLDWSRCYRRGPSLRRLGAPAPRQQLEQRRNH
ncbi:MAG TPA: hypothetical protein VI386_19175 [Candidatus Sulfotelmatobacter sp.]